MLLFLLSKPTQSLGSSKGSPEGNHVVNLVPAMFTYPATPTGEVCIDGDMVDYATVVGRALV